VLRGLTAGLALLAIGVAGCGEKRIDGGDLEAKLRTELTRGAGAVQAKSVDCPEDVKVEKGREFDCTLVAPDGERSTIHVTLTNDEGGLTFVPPSAPGD
jgi:hypothetical protein